MIWNDVLLSRSVIPISNLDATCKCVNLLFIYSICTINVEMGRGKQLDKSEINQTLLSKSNYYKNCDIIK